MENKIGLYARAIGAAVAAAGTAAITGLSGDGHLDLAEWIVVASAFLANLVAVWAIPEFPVKIAKVLKPITSGIVSGLASLASVMVDGHLPATIDWIQIVVAVAVGAGLVHVTNNNAVNATVKSVAPRRAQVDDPNNHAVENEPVQDTDGADIQPVEEDFIVDSESPLEVK